MIALLNKEFQSVCDDTLFVIGLAFLRTFVKLSLVVKLVELPGTGLGTTRGTMNIATIANI